MIKSKLSAKAADLVDSPESGQDVIITLDAAKIDMVTWYTHEYDEYKDFVARMTERLTADIDFGGSDDLRDAIRESEKSAIVGKFMDKKIEYGDYAWQKYAYMAIGDTYFAVHRDSFEIDDNDDSVTFALGGKIQAITLDKDPEGSYSLALGEPYSRSFRSIAEVMLSEEGKGVAIRIPGDLTPFSEAYDKADSAIERADGGSVWISLDIDPINIATGDRVRKFLMHEAQKFAEDMAPKYEYDPYADDDENDAAEEEYYETLDEYESKAKFAANKLDIKASVDNASFVKIDGRIFMAPEGAIKIDGEKVSLDLPRLSEAKYRMPDSEYASHKLTELNESAMRSLATTILRKYKGASIDDPDSRSKSVIAGFKADLEADTADGESEATDERVYE